MLGRAKDTINIAGIKWSCADIENAIEEEGIPGLVANYTVAFPARPPKAPTEQIAIVYRRAYDLEDAGARLRTADAITKIVSSVTGKAPDYLLPVSKGLEKSSLGKISRGQLRSVFEAGQYDALLREDQRILKSYRAGQFQAAETKMERLVQRTVANLLPVTPDSIDMKTSIFDLGVSSFNLIMLKSMLEKAVQKAKGQDETIDIPLSTLLNDPSVRAIARGIDEQLEKPREYNPVVPLQTRGHKTPIWFIHPGLGDVLVFISLASHFSTRPVYALRARGYNAGEDFFSSISETVQTYANSILKHQPQGPHAIAVYSLGGTLAYEVAKLLLSRGREVKFLGSIDSPPHIGPFVTGLDFADVLLHVGIFSSLYDQETMEEEEQRVYDQYRGPGDVQTRRDNAVRHVLQMSKEDRVEGLKLDVKKMALVADITKNFTDCGSGY